MCARKSIGNVPKFSSGWIFGALSAIIRRARVSAEGPHYSSLHSLYFKKVLPLPFSPLLSGAGGLFTFQRHVLGFVIFSLSPFLCLNTHSTCSTLVSDIVFNKGFVTLRDKEYKGLFLPSSLSICNLQFTFFFLKYRTLLSK